MGKIPSTTPYRNVVVAPASHDAGIAVGAAAKVADVTVVPEGKHWGLLGPSHKDTTAHNDSWVNQVITKFSFSNEQKLIEWMVEQLSKEKIFGLFQGRMEFGPRALGSRSIIADPRAPHMRDRLNQRVKHREIFRPFAASVLYEHQEEWFEDCFYSPNMEAVFGVRPEKRSKIPAVTHSDNTCRIQSVTLETQPFYYRLIEAFYQRTGVPMIINTSFNDSEPIVCSAGDAITCFLNTEMDALVMGLDTFSRDASALQKVG